MPRRLVARSGERLNHTRLLDVGEDVLHESAVVRMRSMDCEGTVACVGEQAVGVELDIAADHRAIVVFPNNVAGNFHWYSLCDDVSFAKCAVIINR